MNANNLNITYSNKRQTRWNFVSPRRKTWKIIKNWFCCVEFFGFFFVLFTNRSREIDWKLDNSQREREGKKFEEFKAFWVIPCISWSQATLDFMYVGDATFSHFSEFKVSTSRGFKVFIQFDLHRSLASENSENWLLPILSTDVIIISLHCNWVQFTEWN